MAYYALLLNMTSLKGNRYLTFFISALVDMVAFIAVVFIVRKYVAVYWISYLKDIRLLTVYWYSDRIFLRRVLEARFDSVDILDIPSFL